MKTLGHTHASDIFREHATGLIGRATLLANENESEHIYDEIHENLMNHGKTGSGQVEDLDHHSIGHRSLDEYEKENEFDQFVQNPDFIEDCFFDKNLENALNL